MDSYYFKMMIELVDKYTLVKGTHYYVKRKKKFLKMLNQFDCIFDRYQDGFVWVLLSTFIPVELNLELNDFYRYVSKEEYRSKVKEKYDATCLDIVLRRLVNDDFRW